MGTPFVILGTGQSNMQFSFAMNWSPNARAKHWNNDIQVDTSVGNAYTALPSDSMGVAFKYAHNIAQADASKDVYLIRCAKGGMDLECWVGGSQYTLDYASTGNGKVYLNNPNPALATAMWLSNRDVFGAGHRRTGSNIQPGDYIWVKQGSAVFQYQINSGSDEVAGGGVVSTTINFTCVASTGTLTAGSAVQVERQPRFLNMIEQNVPAALAAAGKSTVDIVLWWQGESDSELNTRYEIDFNFVMSYLSGKPWWGANTKVIICGINSTGNNGFPYCDPFNVRLANLVNGYSNRYFCATAQSLPSNRWLDVWHLTAQGYSDAGDILFNNVYAPPVTPAVSYAIAPSTTSVPEGSGVTYTVTTTSVGSATLYWTNSGSTSAADFVDGQNSGSVVISNDSGSFTRSLSSDGLTESGETIIIQLRTGSTSGPVVATAATVTVTEAGAGGTITSISVGGLTTLMDFTTNQNHRYLSDGSTSYGLWLDGCPHPYRDGAGNMYLMVPHSENYRFKVPNLADPYGWILQGPTLEGARLTAESAYNNRNWLYYGWAQGNTLYGLMHHEWYYANKVVDGIDGFPSYAYGVNRRWVNAISWAQSTNGGLTWTSSPATNSTRLVLVPEPWNVQSGEHMYGFFHPSNIVQEGSYYYAAVEQRTQEPGGATCVCGVSLIRTTNLSTPTGWQFWNGTSWENVNHNFYQGNLGQQVHRFFQRTGVNIYISSQYNSHMGQALRWHTPTNQWLMFGYAGTDVPSGFGFSTSATLANPQFTSIQPVTVVDAGSYGSGNYRTVFDEGATDQNFQNIAGSTATVLVMADFAKIRKATMTISYASSTPTYTITPSTTSITEGQSVTYTITTTNFGNGTLYWTNSGTTTAPDFSDGANSGTIAIANNSGTLTRTLTSDGVAEGTETIILQLRTGSTGGTVVATAATVDVASPTITYNITPYATTINEGQSVNYSVTTTNFGNGTLYWTTTGSVTAADFSDGLMSGSVSVTNNAGTITRTLVADAAVEGSETMTLSLRTDSTAGAVVATATTVTVVDTTTITYNIAPSVTTMDEGQSVTFTVTTTNFGNGTLFWVMTGTTVDADFSDGLTNGSITITNNSGSVTRTLNNDVTTEGTETFALQLLTGSVTGTVVASSATVTVNDSSKSSSSAVCWIRNLANGSWINAMLAAGMRFRNLVNNTWLNKTGTLTGVGVRDMGNTKWITFGTPPPVPTYTITPSVTTVNEGGAVTYTITTTNFGSGTLYWTNGGSSVGADFTDGLNSGSITITNNGGVLTRTLTSDGVTESTETIILQLRTGSTSGTIVATASTVNIVDASVPTYSISPSVSSVNEGQSVTYTITTTNFGSGTLYWTNSGSTVDTDFSDGLNSGGVSITNNSGTLTRTLASDGITESTETIIIQLRTGSTAGAVVATAATVSVINVATPTYSITPSVTTVNEGQSVTYTITTTNFGNGTLYWTTTGSVTAADFGDSITSGSVTITNNSGSVTRTLSADLTTEGNETMFILLRTGSTSGSVVATADGVNVIDTSTSPATLASPLVFTRNDLDFIYSSVVSGAEPTYMEVIMTVDCTNFFNYATDPISHLVFALDPRGDSSVYYSNGTRDHCGQIVRRGQALFDGARGFIIDRTGTLAAEHWYDGAGFGISDQGFGFNPLVYKVFTVRIRAGYRNGSYGNRMEIDVFNGTTINGTLLTGASLAWGWDWPGYTRMVFGAIGGGFVSPNDTSCVETSGAGPAAGATVVTSNFSLKLHYY